MPRMTLCQVRHLESSSMSLTSMSNEDPTRHLCWEVGSKPHTFPKTCQCFEIQRVLFIMTLYVQYHSHHLFICILTLNTAMYNKEASLSYSLLSRSKQGSGYITASSTLSDNGYKNVCSKFSKGTATARQTNIPSRFSSPGSYTISKNLSLRPLILPTSCWAT